MEIVASIECLTGEELSAVRAAAAWYASYHATDSAYAVIERERYLAFVTGLRKLDVRIALPDGIAAPPEPFIAARL